ncbi:MAG: MFS transporter [Maricaulaceae bacterium]
MTSQEEARQKNYRTTVLVLLTLVYTFNFIDRQIIGAVSPFIKDEMGLSDRQLGFLKGFAFAALYCTVGIPIAWLADRYNRVKIISISLAVWSAFTALTGLAQTTTTLMLARVGVGIGEAGGSPPSHSIISDLYPKEKRASALGFYSLGIPLGIMFAYFAAGQLVTTLGWRGTLIALGLPGILLALLVYVFVKEPKRGAMEAFAKQASQVSDELPAPTLKETFSTLMKIPSWWAMCMGITFVSFGGYAVVNWGVDYLTRWDPSMKEPDNFRWLLSWLGLINGVAFGIGTYGGAVLADWFGKKSIRAYGWLPAVALIIGVPCLIYAFWVDDIKTYLILLTVYLTMNGVYLGPSFAIAQTLAPIRMRAMSTALFFFILNMIALGGGPWFIGEISQLLTAEHGETHALRLSLTWLIVPYTLSILAFFWASRTLPKDWAEAEARNQRA